MKDFGGSDNSWQLEELRSSAKFAGVTQHHKY